jgi:hypothetical protein
LGKKEGPLGPFGNLRPGSGPNMLGRKRKALNQHNKHNKQAKLILMIQYIEI